MSLTVSQLRLANSLVRTWWLWVVLGLLVAGYVQPVLPTGPMFWCASALVGIVSYRALIRVDLHSRGSLSMVFGLAIFFLMPVAKWLGGAAAWSSTLHLSGTVQYLGCVFAMWGICARVGRLELIALQSSLTTQLEGQRQAAEESEPGWVRRISVRRHPPSE
ncbi:hypothetical protein HNQ59_001967 [Chitinivorax tropicus]|uniref:Transmembrane protein n=1 Tax=Chitinivorax tropicus TaxID=714531 RepID=A0A840MQE0_9PROT|nr:hypothetical protein [Chitinivorax tropicus]MBB5018676.1 hypothetical protein [Chitinivorax tropicus]